MSNKELLKLNISEARQALDKGEFSAVELTKAYVESMEKSKDLNAYITETPELALEQAKQSDEKIKKGDAGILEGIPLGVKDLFCTKDVLTTAASKMLGNFVPPYESTVTANLKAQGSVLLGKLNCDEFAMGGANLTSYYGSVKNPWNKECVPGGSSGGSAAAVSGGLCAGATGTDTGGSIRQPSAYSGITGIKPTYGRCSRWGVVAFASSLDQAGPMARSVKDCAMMLQSMAGFDEKDSTSANVELPDFAAAITGDIRGKKVGIPKEYRQEGLDKEIEACWEKGVEWLKQAGAEVVEVSLPHTKYAVPAYYIISPAEASSNLARYDGVRYGLRVDGDSLDEMYMNTRGEGFGEEVRRRIMIGTYVLSAGYYDAYYKKAQQVRALIAQDFEKAFEKVDVLLTPTAPTPAFSIKDGANFDPVTMYLMDVFTVPTSLAGLPGLSLPTGLSSSGMPLGLQLIGRPFDEETVFKFAGVMEDAAMFDKTPRLAEDL
jgi:aspartyl-tRNA(Asn)/glutamyl-tRNA(Gln) amidotransferase subunit A